MPEGARVASLGMYDHPALHAANDALWTALARRLEAAGIARVPATLDRGRPPAAIWRDPGLLLGQTCGYPLAARLAGTVRYVATPRYRAPGCTGPRYRSRIVVRADDTAATLADLRSRRAAINDPDSNSGMNLLRAALASLALDGRFLGGTIETGAHIESVRAVAGGAADLAAIDAVSFAHLEAYEPALTAAVRTIGWTPDAPGLPLVTAAAATDEEVAILCLALDDIARDPALATIRDTLLLDGFDRLPHDAYDEILAIERSAQTAGYPILA